MEIKIVVYSPVRHDHYIADVYVGEKRVYHGTAYHMTKHSAIIQAIEWMQYQQWMD